MVDRLRAFLEAPLDASVARAVTVLALAASTGFAIVVLLAGLGDGPSVGSEDTGSSVATRPPVGEATAASRPGEERQDPQDRPGTPAHRRAERESAGHRALQHVPYAHGGVTIELVGARRGRAVLRVAAVNEAAARRGWQRFLRRFHDRGTAYEAHFVVEPVAPGGRRG